jgi:hypothetical protein
VIAVEDLTVNQMVHNHCLAFSVEKHRFGNAENMENFFIDNYPPFTLSYH